MKKISHTKVVSLLSAMLILALAGCSPKEKGELGSPADASFTITPVAGRVNTFLLTSTSTNAINYQWDKGNGNFVKGKAIDTAYFPLKGTYTVQLRAFGRGGYDTASRSVVVDVDDILSNPQFQMLTAKTWKLDPAAGANAIIVGTEANPAQYFGGGALAGCQTDDTYTFTTALKLTYNAAGATFNGGNIAPNFSCDSDRSYSNLSFTFTPGVTAGAGLATITLPGAVPANFIGVTDVSSNFYRIISISANAMVLRSGTTTETVHQFKFIAQ
jgi:PKD repeat protein